MILVIIKILLFLSAYAVLFLMLRKGARIAAYPPDLRKTDRNSNNSSNDDGEGSWPKDFPKLDLPPGVYILPPGAPDPSQRKEPVR
ncbi:MAG: hypothetical protein RMJ87_04320 [Cytophagales bacterium]|nr:hypothetical protein [Bernardetiaceae bacterium]MDW8204235.1 hypothetical protein [Cytophagales bacterium]